MLMENNIKYIFVCLSYIFCSILMKDISQNLRFYNININSCDCFCILKLHNINQKCFSTFPSYLELEALTIMFSFIQQCFIEYLLDTINLLGPGDRAGTRQKLSTSPWTIEFNVQFSILKKVAIG